MDQDETRHEVASPHCVTRGPSSPPQILGQCLLWPNGWLDHDATWYRGRPQVRPHCVRRGPSSPKKGHSPQFLAHIYCGKMTVTGWRNVWNMRWRAPDKEIDQKGHGQRLCKKIAKHAIWTGRMLQIVVDGRSWYRLGDDQDGGWWVFLLVPAHLSSPGQRAVKRLLLLLTTAAKRSPISATAEHLFGI